MREFESLNVWKEAKTVTLDIYEIFKDCRDYGFKDQIQRASVSIMNNIAEGSESGSDAKFINFLNISYGSCGEVKSMLYLAEDLGFLTAEQSQKLRQQCTDLSIKITALIEYLQNTTKPTQTTQSQQPPSETTRS